MKFLSNILIKAGLVVEGSTDLYAAAAVVDTDKFVVLDGNTIKYRTGAEVLSDIGGVSGTGSAGQVSYWTGSTTQGGSNSLFWDTTNLRLGIGTNIPAARLHVLGSIITANSTFIYSSIDGNTDGNLYITANAGTANTTSSSIIFRSSLSGAAITERMRVTALGNLHVGTFFSDSGHKLQVSGTAIVSSFLNVGSDVATASVIKNFSADGSLVYAGSSFNNSSLPTRTIIISSAGTYSGLTGGSNLFVGRNAGSSVTTGTSNVFIGKSAGAGITTGGSNVMVVSSDATNLPSALANSIHIVGGNGYRSNDASTIPSATHAFIGGGFNTGAAVKDFYFGQMPFTADAGSGLVNIVFYAPSGSGTDIGGSNFTIAAGRGTGTGTPGDFIIQTSTATTTGTTLQTLTTRLRVAGGTGVVTMSNLSGTGTRMVVADDNGVLSTQSLGAGAITGTGTAGQVAYFTGATTQAGSNNLFWDNTNAKLGIGTASPQQGLSIIRNENTSSGIETQNTSTGAAANSGIIVRNSSSSGQLFKLSTGYTTYKTLVANDLGFYNGTSGDISLLNDVAAGKIKFLTGTASVAQMTLTANGRLLLGSTTEGTQILQVTGTSLLNGNTQFGGFLSNTSAGSPLEVRANVAATTSFAVYYSSALSAVSGTYNILTTSGQQFTPTSGTAVFNSFVSNVTINQTGGANGITRGLYVNPTLTAAADWRSIEWSNNSGWGLRGEGTAPNYLAGNLLIGSTNNFSKLYVGGVTSTTTSQTFIFSQPSITGALTDLYSFNSNILGNLTVNVTNAHHFRASQSGLSTSTITNQYGFFVDSSLVGATNNFGFYGNIASGTNRWNLYMNGTADNYMAGSLGIGQTTLTGYNLRISNNITGITSPIAVFVDGTIQATATGANQIFRSSPSVVASATISEIRHFSALQGTFGAGSTVSTQTGFFVHSGMTGATTDYGFYGDLAAATNVWNLYMNGTANNYLNGSLLIGSTTDSGEKLQVTGTMKVTGASSFGSNLTTSGFFSKTNSAVAIQTALWGVAQNVGGADNGTAITLGVDNTTAYGQMQLAFDNLTSGTRTSFRFLTNDGSTLSERVRFDWRGNIGLGITPSAWGITNSTRALQMNAGTMWSFGSSSVFLGQNYFYNGSARVYYTTAAATEYAQISGAHIWYNAPSGTAGNAITFTQAMTLDASGNLLVGGTSVYGATITSYGSSTRSGGMGIRNSAGTIAGFYGTYAAGSGSGSTDILVESAGFMLFSAAGAERMRLTATNGNLHIGTFTADSGEKLQVTGTAKITSKLSIGAGTTSNAQINLASSTAPTSPNNGDIWFDGTNIKIQVGGVTRTFTLI